MTRHSIAIYPDNWNEIAKSVKDAAGWKCIRCGHRHAPEDGYCLTVHHLDMDPSNNRWWNLLALCQKCHLHIQAKVYIERLFMFEHSVWFQPYAAGYYASKYGLIEDKEFVLANLDQILDFGRPIHKYDDAPVLQSGIAS
jgi:hypothetical protein